MHTTLLAPQRPAAPPRHLPLAPLQSRTPRTGALDRIALRVALALLLWGTRPAADASRLELEQAARAARDERERAWRDAAAHHLPIR